LSALEFNVRTIPTSVIEFSGNILTNKGAASGSERSALPVTSRALTCLLPKSGLSRMHWHADVGSTLWL
jgi:hypothetical protein